jgi:ribosomal protein S18 acetylase RimI-like enzyme
MGTLKTPGKRNIGLWLTAIGYKKLVMNKDIVYRNAVPDDCLKLSILYKQVYIQTYGTEGVSDEFAHFISQQFAVERLEQTIKALPGNIIVALYKNNLVGVVEIELEKKCPVGTIIAPELNKLYILEWFCGIGIGNSLLQEAEKFVLSKGINEMWLWVLETNARAISFYERQGYNTIGNASFQMEVNKYENKVMLKKLGG